MLAILPSITPRSPTLAAALCAALVSAVACNDTAPSEPTPLPDVYAAERARPAASAEWSEIARNLVTVKQANSLQGVRIYAILNVAQEEAVLAADRTSSGRNQLSRRAAVAAASAVALAYLYPAEDAQLEERVRQQIATPGWLEADAPNVEAGLAAGRAAAAAVAARAKTDRVFEPWTGTVPTGPGMWYSSATPAAPPGGVGYSVARPFFLTSPSQFRPAPPPAFGSPAFQTALAEVRRISDARTAAQDSLAKFWAFPGGTMTLGGWWNREAAAAAAGRGFGERRTAQLLALVSAAGFDATVACNDAKYVHWQLRPTQADPAITLPIALPNFPAYPSNTACISAAEAEVIGARVPELRQRLRTLAEEAAHSRIYAGIHYRFDGEAGLELGRQVGRQALAARGGE